MDVQIAVDLLAEYVGAFDRSTAPRPRRQVLSWSLPGDRAGLIGAIFTVSYLSSASPPLSPVPPYPATACTTPRWPTSWQSPYSPPQPPAAFRSASATAANGRGFVQSSSPARAPCRHARCRTRATVITSARDQPIWMAKTFLCIQADAAPNGGSVRNRDGAGRAPSTCLRVRCGGRTRGRWLLRARQRHMAGDRGSGHADRGPAGPADAGVASARSRLPFVWDWDWTVLTAAGF
jgi:hypothetical protein